MEAVADDGTSVPPRRPRDMTDTTELFDRPPTPAPRGGRDDNRPPLSDLIVLAAIKPGRSRPRSSGPAPTPVAMRSS